MSRVEIRIDPAHPSTVGHFPGRPIVPGAMLLDEVMRALNAMLGHEVRHVELDGVKFLAPVLPGQAVRMELHDGGDSSISFRGSVHERVVISGTVKVIAP